MSIWRSLECSKCKGEYFDVADNYLNIKVRIACMKCGKETILNKQAGVQRK